MDIPNQLRLVPVSRLQNEANQRQSRFPGRRGLSAVEVLIVVVILVFFLLLLMMSLPRRRESSRRLACQQNLMQIGVAVAIYDQDETHLPTVPKLGPNAEQQGSSPLKALLETLALADFTQLADPNGPRPKSQNGTIEEKPVRGFVCPSDPNTKMGWFRAPISYRATAGSTSAGNDGVFSPGRRVKLADIEAGDGLSYTAAFAERLVGNNQPADRLENYAVVEGPLTEDQCPSPLKHWKGDAGATWFVTDWASTLYNHALVPNARPSCVSSGTRSALMGASSGHPGGVNVLFFDGGVKFYGSGVAPKIWRDLATPGFSRPPETPSASKENSPAKP